MYIAFFTRNQPHQQPSQWETIIILLAFLQCTFVQNNPSNFLLLLQKIIFFSFVWWTCKWFCSSSLVADYNYFQRNPSLAGKITASFIFKIKAATLFGKKAWLHWHETISSIQFLLWIFTFSSRNIVIKGEVCTLWGVLYEIYSKMFLKSESRSVLVPGVFG